jgi:hypothetical protein
MSAAQQLVEVRRQHTENHFDICEQYIELLPARTLLSAPGIPGPPGASKVDYDVSILNFASALDLGNT